MEILNFTRSGNLFPWEMFIKILIPCFLNVEKILNSAQINLSSTLTENIFSTQQYPTEKLTSEIDADLQNEM